MADMLLQSSYLKLPLKNPIADGIKDVLLMFFFARSTLIRLPDGSISKAGLINRMIRINEYLSSFSFERCTIPAGQLPVMTANHFAGRVNNTSESTILNDSMLSTDPL